MKCFYCLFFFTVFMCGCFEKRISDPIKVYARWKHPALPAYATIGKAHFWQSAHWSYEFALFLRLDLDSDEKKRFFEERKLERNEIYVGGIEDITPKWFVDIDKAILYSSEFDDADYFLHPDYTYIYVRDVHF